MGLTVAPSRSRIRRIPSTVSLVHHRAGRPLPGPGFEDRPNVWFTFEGALHTRIGKFASDVDDRVPEAVDDRVPEAELHGHHLVAGQRNAAQRTRTERLRVPVGGLGGVRDDDVRSDVHPARLRQPKPDPIAAAR
jgi:hypothetical protein